MRGVEETAQAYRKTRCRLNEPDMQPVHLNRHAVKWERGVAGIFPLFSLLGASLRSPDQTGKLSRL